MPDYTKDITSTNMPASSISTSTQNGCALCPNLSTNLNNSSEYDNSPVLIELITKNISSVSELQKDVLNLEKEQEKSRELYKSISKLAKTSRIVLLFLIVVPIIQLVGCIVTVYYIGAQQSLSELLNWVIGGIGIMSGLEVVIAYTKLSNIEKNVDKLESKVERLEDKK